MVPVRVLFVNCTLKRSPETSNTEALWQCVAPLYRQQNCLVQQRRTVDLQPYGAAGDMFSALLADMQSADILIVGTPVRWGNRSSECQKLIECLQAALRTRVDPATGQPLLYNKVFGLLTVEDLAGGAAGSGPAAQTCYDFGRLGCIQPPDNTVIWARSGDTDAGFIEAEGRHSAKVNRAAQLLVENSVAIARLLHQAPLTAHLHEATRYGRAVAKAARVETAAQVVPKAICTKDNPLPNSIDYRHLTKRIWTVMQAGMQRGFTFKVISLEDRIFRAERAGKGFIYKIYPGHFSFRSQYDDFDGEQCKSHKLALMQQRGLAVPTDWGTFKTFADIPLERLPYPIVAKPDSGSLSQHVFPNLKDADQLRQAAAEIEASGSVIKLESHVTGRDYRVAVLAGQYAGCVERRPANVVGDSQHTILELFHQRNQEPGRGDRYEAHTTIHKLVFDETSRRLLQQAGYTLDTVLPTGKICYLQEKITASTGSDYVDCTDLVHPSIIESCVAFSRHFSTLTLGFDVIATDISRSLAETGGAFNEYNFLPYVDLHENCNIGQKRPVCQLIWDYIEARAEKLVTAQFNPF